jgi:glycosyltransferase involved in cell wall biosynthesis
MNIVMTTNTFTPHVGGVARSVVSFSAEYRARGHRVLVIAPEFPDMPKQELDVVRIPAIQNFNGSDFSLVLPLSGLLSDELDQFQPDIIHSHHPYLLGVTALRVARFRQLPLVFTHHTRYEEYTHYVPGHATLMRRFIIEAATHYANLADQVFAPSESINSLLRERGVTTPVRTVPTGVNVARFASGDGAGFRTHHDIPADAFVVGHLGRLAPEKNIPLLADAMTVFGKAHNNAHFLVVGKGPSRKYLVDAFEQAGLGACLHLVDVLQQPQLSDALHAMDVFAFASKSETQGMVLTEAMAASLPVVALDAPGAREVVNDRRDGRLLFDDSPEGFADALQWIAEQSSKKRRMMSRAARTNAETFSMCNTASAALDCYETLKTWTSNERKNQEESWHRLLELIKVEWEIIKGIGSATGSALVNSERKS